MKTFLIVLAILILLGIVVFLLIRKPEKVIDDDSIIKPGADYDIDKGFVENHQGDKPQDGCLQESKEKETEEDKAIEVNIPEHCRIPKDPTDDLNNKYFFNIHKYTSKKGRNIYCVVCNAVIKFHNYRVVVENSYYPYVGSYTRKAANTIASKYTQNMTPEEFLKTGSTDFERVGEIVDALTIY